MTITPYPGKQGTTYRVRVELAPDPVTGARRRLTETVRGTRRDAERCETRLKAQAQEGLIAAPDRMTLSDLAYQWIEDIITPNTRASTLYGYRRTLEVHILPFLGTQRVQQLTGPQIQTFYSARRRTGVSDTMLDRCHKRLRQLFRQAIAWGILARNPCDQVTPPRVVRPERRVWDQGEVVQFLTCKQTIAHPTLPLWLLILTTGVRKGEALGLRWRDVDLTAGTIQIRQVVSVVGTAAAIHPPKTRASRRQVRLAPELVTALRQHRTAWVARRLAAPDWEATDLVFCTRTGGLLHPNNVSTVFRRLVAHANVPPITIHDLRHTNVSHLLSAGLSVALISNRIGHRNPATTAGVYAHMLPGDQDAAVLASSRLLQPVPASPAKEAG